MPKEREIEEIYQKKTQHEHIMLRPDTYIGSIQFDKQHLFVFNEEKQEIEQREINFVPGLYKIFGIHILHLLILNYRWNSGQCSW